MKTSKAFRLTKVHLWDGTLPRSEGKSSYICWAADKMTSWGGRRKVQKVVGDLLGDCCILEEWLRKRSRKYKQPDSSFDNKAYNAWRLKVQQARHAWLDHLIAHYESKGD